MAKEVAKKVSDTFKKVFNAVRRNNVSLRDDISPSELNDFLSTAVLATERIQKTIFDDYTDNSLRDKRKDMERSIENLKGVLEETGKVFTKDEEIVRGLIYDSYYGEKRYEKYFRQTGDRIDRYCLGTRRSDDSKYDRKRNTIVAAVAGAVISVVKYGSIEAKENKIDAGLAEEARLMNSAIDAENARVINDTYINNIDKIHEPFIHHNLDPAYYNLTPEGGLDALQGYVDAYGALRFEELTSIAAGGGLSPKYYAYINEASQWAGNTPTENAAYEAVMRWDEVAGSIDLTSHVSAATAQLPIIDGVLGAVLLTAVATLPIVVNRATSMVQNFQFKKLCKGRIRECESELAQVDIEMNNREIIKRREAAENQTEQMI